MIEYKNYGVLKDTKENRKKNYEVKYFPCCDCGSGNIPVEKTTSIIDSNSFLVSGTHAAQGYIKKSEWFQDVRCKKCRKKYNEYHSSFY